MPRALVAAAWIAGAALLVSGCGSRATRTSPTAVGESTPPRAAATQAATPTPPATTTEPPLPRHVTFAPGEAVRADSQAGIFFLDPRTGAAEGWLVPAPGGNPFAFELGGVSADGRTIVYACKEDRADSSPVPCGGGSVDHWYLFDTSTGHRTRLPGGFRRVALSPDGHTVVGASADGIALVDGAGADAPRRVGLPPGTDTSWFAADWSTDSTRVVLSGTFGATLVRVSDGRAQGLGGGAYASWAPDGSRFALARGLDETHSALVMFDRDGRPLWSKPIAAPGVAARWSADGTLLYAEEVERPPALAAYGSFDRVVIIDAASGATRYRVPGASCPTGWVGPSHRLLASTYAFGVALIDLDLRTVRLLDRYARPTPFDASLAIMFDGSDFSSYDIDTGAIKLIARTTVTPAWDENHGALFAGRRIVFTAGHLGHGGCGEGAPPKDPTPPRLLAGPFADDAAVTLGSPAP